MGELLARLGALLLGEQARGSAWPRDDHHRARQARRQGQATPRRSVPSDELPTTAMQRYRALEARALKRLRLSPRESEVATRILQGATYRDIADNLFIAEGTVRFHAHHIFEKAEVANRRSFERSMRRWLARSAASTPDGRHDTLAPWRQGPGAR